MDPLSPDDSKRSPIKLKFKGPLAFANPSPLHLEHAIILRSPHFLHIPRELLWEAEMKASILGAAMVAQRSKVPTPKPAISLAVIFSIRPGLPLSGLVESGSLVFGGIPARCLNGLGG